jgi:hypothetical protein
MKPAKTPFSYVVLRYMHDVFTREFVNVGVLLRSPRTGFLAFEKLSSLDRAKGMFPGLHSDTLRDLLAFLVSRTEELRIKTSDALDRDRLSADIIAKTLLPIDDSALQWSAPGGGVTDDPARTLKDLFERLVARHLKSHPPTRRDDDDVWKPFEYELRKRDVLPRLHEKVLSVGELQLRFDAAWQPIGSYLRLYKPLSFDLVDPSNIVEKAVRWSALVRQLRKGDQDFFIYLLVGAPRDTSHMRAFDQAVEALKEDEPGRKQLVPEEDAPVFAQQVEEEVKALAS